MVNRMRSLFSPLALAVLLVGMITMMLYGRANPQCSSLFANDLLPNTDFSVDADGDNLPDGWDAVVKGPIHLAAKGDYTVTGQGRSVQIIGIANALYSPIIAIQPGMRYCLVAQVLADQAPAPTRMQVRFHWLDATKNELSADTTDWQIVKTPAGGGWSLLRASFSAPLEATRLQVSFHPASDDRIYIDEIHLRYGGTITLTNRHSDRRVPSSSLITLNPWPYGKKAALSFSFDWETAMGGLIHSRSVEDPYSDQDPIIRGMRMRQGVTETLQIFQRYGIRATYFANGYNFLTGNRERTIFMNDPTYEWATAANRWTSDWSMRPWFSLDPYTDYRDTSQNGAAWYFGDLIPVLKRAQQDIQSHTFSHFYGGFVRPSDWQADFVAWRDAAISQGVSPAQSLAFPWSGSGGMSYAAWDVLAENDIRVVTRLSHQLQYRLFAYEDDVPVAPRCIPIPGHESILGCPDVYLTPGARETKAIQAIDAALKGNGMVDIWAHTEEVTTPAQIETWKRVVTYASNNPDLWIAPITEIAQWQHATRQVHIQDIQPTISLQSKESLYQLTVDNRGDQPLNGITLTFPFSILRAQVGNQQFITHDTLPGDAIDQNQVTFSLGARQKVILYVWCRL